MTDEANLNAPAPTTKRAKAKAKSDAKKAKAQSKADAKAGRSTTGAEARTTDKNNRTLNAPPDPNNPSGTYPSVPPMRAKFVLTEINQTSRGVAVLKLKAAHDGDILDKHRLVPGANPIGDATIEVSPDYAASLGHGAAFYLQFASR